MQHLTDEAEWHTVTIPGLSPVYLQQQTEGLCYAGRQIVVRACIPGGEAWDASLLAQRVVRVGV